MPATFAIDDGLPKVSLSDGTELWLGLQAIAAFRDGAGADQTTWLPMPFWGFGRRIGSTAIRIGQDERGRKGVPAKELLESMILDGADDVHLGHALVASRGLVEHSLELAGTLPSPLKEAYTAQLESFVAGLQTASEADPEQPVGDEMAA
jgi:hypothetical protein